MSDIADSISAILHKYGILNVVTDKHVTITDKTVSDFAKPVSHLSEWIIESLWPRIHTASVYHFTSREAAESILSTQTFRLQNIAKRYDEGEISTFCHTHKLTGYLQKDANGRPTYRTLLMPNIYYASFTDAGLSEREQEVLWRRFAANDGVRLTLQIEASNPNFRRMKYEQKCSQQIPVLAELASTLSSQYNRQFILSGISRLCAFYLPESDYGQENELRMLYKTCEGIGPQPVGNGAASYVELPLGLMSEAGYKLDVVDVCSTTKPAIPRSIRFTPRATT